MLELSRRFVEDMKLAGLAEGTQQLYLDAAKQLARHCSVAPDQLTEEQVREYFCYLTQKSGLAQSTIRIRLFGLKFLYTKTLGRTWPLLSLARVKRPKRLPVVLSADEVWQLLNLIQTPTARMSATMMYACGMRASEAVGLRVEDIDSKRMVAWVRRGKGDKDRQVPLPVRILNKLRQYWREQRPMQPWLFSDTSGQKPINRHTVIKCIKAACKEGDIRKPVSCHTLRHSYATHLLEHGADLRTIQGLLGHATLRSTMVYLHLTQGVMANVRKTIDELMDGR